ncbi:hypothetical protein P154DRAFT_143199 [Amniculicola lignicola CBS 123094]|uniref:Osmotin, thaumatin-like protein n=1 Tax=Amniculicola lignicola CBS 123094 TaxID=1392246 RepID=A0A6A5WKN2_9PLEO|nr:hypothetical protein P154DRAFT_143199 [Amniculicola lignicola CBS 123094]
MQLLAFASAAALLAVGVSANTYDYSHTCPSSSTGRVRVFNRCPYDVYLWSIVKEPGCPSGGAAVIPSGGFYCEKMREAQGDQGVSIKISKTATCSSSQLLQLEYFLETTKPGYNYNYLDVSYVDCPGNDCDCPTRKEGYYLKSGNDNAKTKSAGDNKICPILSCDGSAACDKMSYVLWNDEQTKSCDLDAPLDFYMCGSEAPGEEVSAPSVAPSSSSSEKKDKPSSTEPEPSSTPEDQVQAAAITPPPSPEETQALNIKTEVVYVTEYATVVNRKRHGHARRHEHFRA